MRRLHWIEAAVVWLVRGGQKFFSPWHGAHLAYGLACLLMGYLLLVLDASWWPVRPQTLPGTPEEVRHAFGWFSLFCGLLLVYPVKCKVDDWPRCPAWQMALSYTASFLGGMYLTVLGFLSGVGELGRHEAPSGWIFAILAGRFFLAAVSDLWNRRGKPRNDGGSP